MTSFQDYFFAFCLIGVFLAGGMFLRLKVKIFQTLFLPSSIIAGFLALLCGPHIINIIPEQTVKIWSQIPGSFISIVFASLFLGVALPKVKAIWNIGGPMLCFGVVTGVGQYFVALLAAVLILIPFFNVSPVFACILEVGFSGGHGTAAGMTELFNKIGFPEGGALGQMSATVGIIYAVVMGIAFVNIFIRKGYTAHYQKGSTKKIKSSSGLIPEGERKAVSIGTVSLEVIDPITFHFIVIGLAVLVGYILLYLLKLTSPIMQSFPLFPLAMIGGLIVQKLSSATGVDKYYDKKTFDRIMGFSLDMLIVSAIASLRLDLFLQNVFPFMILMIVGMLWLLFMVLVMAPRMFPEHWCERSVTEFGMQSGVTAIGLVLLRLVDPDYKTGTAEAFGLKQMVYEPFLGGGFITALSPYFILAYGAWMGIVLALVIMLIFFGISFFSGWTNLKMKA